jgi:hypothetical protein
MEVTVTVMGNHGHTPRSSRHLEHTTLGTISYTAGHGRWGGAGAGMAMGLEPAGLGRRKAIRVEKKKYAYYNSAKDANTHYQPASGRASWGLVLFLRLCPPSYSAPGSGPGWAWCGSPQLSLIK